MKGDKRRPSQTLSKYDNKRRSLTPTLKNHIGKTVSPKDSKRMINNLRKPLTSANNIKYDTATTNKKPIAQNLKQIQNKYKDWYKTGMSNMKDSITPFTVYKTQDTNSRLRRSITPTIQKKKDYSTSGYTQIRSQGKTSSNPFRDTNRRALTPNITRKSENLGRLNFTEYQKNNNNRMKPLSQPKPFNSGGSVVTNVNQSFGYGGVSKSFLEKITNQEFYDKNLDSNFQKYINELTNQVVHGRSLKMKMATMPFRGSTDVPFTKSSIFIFF